MSEKSQKEKLQVDIQTLGRHQPYIFRYRLQKSLLPANQCTAALSDIINCKSLRRIKVRKLDIDIQDLVFVAKSILLQKTNLIILQG